MPVHTHCLELSPFTIARTQTIYCCAIWLILDVSVWGSTIKRGVYSSFSDYISVFTLVLSAILQHVRIASSALRLPLAKPYMWEGKKQAPSAWTQLGVSTHGRLFWRPILCLRIKISNCAQDRPYWVMALLDIHHRWKDTCTSTDDTGWSTDELCANWWETNKGKSAWFTEYNRIHSR